MIEEIKAGMTIREAMRHLGMEEKAGNLICSPLRADTNPSFSIYDNDRRWKDHSTGDGGDVIDFWKAATGLDINGCLKELAGILKIDSNPRLLRMKHRPKNPPIIRKVPKLQVKKDKLVTLAEGRLFRAFLAWCAGKGIAEDVAYRVAQTERVMDYNGMIAFVYESGVKVRMNIRDSHTAFWLEGTGQNLWGTPIRDTKELHLCEGESDAMKLMSVVKGADVRAMPAASWRPSPLQAYATGAFRKVVLWMDGDKAGRTGQQEIAAIFNEHADGCNVVIVTMPDGMDVCDLTAEQIKDTYLLTYGN